MSRPRRPALERVRGRLGRRAHELIDRRVAEQLARQRQAIVQEAFARGRAAALHEYRLFGPPDRLHLAPTAQVHSALFNTVSGSITVADQAFFGHDVAVLTGTHDIERLAPERGHAIPDSGRDVVVESGAWVSSRAILIGPCRIGADAVVAAGSLVTEDVPARTVVAGAPARVIRRLEAGDAGEAGTLGVIPPARDVDTGLGRMYLHAGEEEPAGGPDAAATPRSEALRAAIRPGATVVDVGAGVGHVSLLMAQAVGATGRVVAVEPHPVTVRLLRANLARHGHVHAEVVAAATGPTAGRVELAGWPRRVAAVRLDDVLRDADRVEVLHLDTQGSEHAALDGARELVSSSAPLIFARYEPAGLRAAGEDPRAVLAFYRDLGYLISVVEHPELGEDVPAERIAAVEGPATLLLTPSARA